MSWRSITIKEQEICEKMVLWLELRRKWQPNSPWLPSNADISKSALFERLMNGRDPLEFPPPRGLSCPWYAVVEDKGPHYVGDNYSGKENSIGPYFHIYHPNHNITNISHNNAEVGHEVTIWQSSYWIEEKLSPSEFIIKDANYDTPYRFRLWYDEIYVYQTIMVPPPKGGWMIHNINFDVGEGVK